MLSFVWQKNLINWALLGLIIFPVYGLFITPISQAEEQAKTLKIPSKTDMLIQLLVDEGVISGEKADALLEQLAEAEKRLIAERLEQAKQTQTDAQAQGTVLVPYIPEFVKEEIKSETRIEMREQLIQDVIQHAEGERWGVPGTLPAWIDRLSFSGDIRLRSQFDSFDSLNEAVAEQRAYFNVAGINDDGFFDSSRDSQQFSFVQDRFRLRERARFGVKAKVTSFLTTEVSLATGSAGDPVSTNQTLGNNGKRQSIGFDLAYIRYKYFNLDDFNFLTLWGGRMKNPFFSTDLVWDSDLRFEGVAAKYAYSLGGGDDLFELNDSSKQLFLTLGAFPLEEFDLYEDDKWLYAAQFGTDIVLSNQNRFRVALAIYDFENITGVQNAPNSNDTDFTASGSLQKGNLVFDISDPNDTESALFGLASEFTEVNLTMEASLANFSPIHMLFTLDYVKNIAWDGDEIEERINGAATLPFVGPGTDVVRDLRRDEPTEGFQAKFTLGWPTVSKRRDWNVSYAYKRLESDAVVDAFTDSDFHLGGTDAQGWILGGQYGLTDNTWIQARLLSTREIDYVLMGVDTWQIDLNTKF